jgi:hypothetical protein
MATITSKMVEETYKLGVNVFKKQINGNQAANKLNSELKMNYNSALMYVYNIQAMLLGRQYKRIMKEEDTNYFLMQILKEFGNDYFNKALFAVKLHIDYIKSINKPSNVEQLYNQLLKKHDIQYNNWENNAVIDESTGDIEDKNSSDDDIESPLKFTYEKDLQTALVRQAENLFIGYKIYGEDLEGIEYTISGRRIDLLLESASNNSLLAIELKSGIADFKVFGQISMYLGLLSKEFPDKILNGVIIAGKIDDTLKNACLLTDKIKLMTYKMELKLENE